MIKEKKEHNYCIPSPLASFMKKIDDRTQMEASLLSMTMLLLGLLFFGSYVVFFSEFSLMFKITTGFNTLCGFVFMFSYLITTFHQYQALMETQEIIGSFGTDEPFPSNSKQMKGGLD